MTLEPISSDICLTKDEIAKVRKLISGGDFNPPLDAEKVNLAIAHLEFLAEHLPKTSNELDKLSDMARRGEVTFIEGSQGEDDGGDFRMGDDERRYANRDTTTSVDMPFAWKWNSDEAKFDNNYAVFGRTLYTVSDGNEDITTPGDYYVHFTHTSDEVSAALETGSALEADNDDENTYLLVATLTGEEGETLTQTFSVGYYPQVIAYAL